jgi:hypothetical protein
MILLLGRVVGHFMTGFLILKSVALMLMRLLYIDIAISGVESLREDPRHCLTIVYHTALLLVAF